MYTNSLSLFDVLTKANITTEKCLMIDLKWVMEPHKHMEIGDISYDNSEHNFTDALNIKKSSILIKSLKTINNTPPYWAMDSMWKSYGP